jgi:hypothetical protein
VAQAARVASRRIRIPTAYARVAGSKTPHPTDGRNRRMNRQCPARRWQYHHGVSGDKAPSGASRINPASLVDVLVIVSYAVTKKPAS